MQKRAAQNELCVEIPDRVVGEAFGAGCVVGSLGVTVMTFCGVFLAPDKLSTTDPPDGADASADTGVPEVGSSFTGAVSMTTGAWRPAAVAVAVGIWKTFRQ